MNIERITLDPSIMEGKPCIRGMRVTVGTVLGLLAGGHPRERILEAYPYSNRPISTRRWPTLPGAWKNERSHWLPHEPRHTHRHESFAGMEALLNVRQLLDLMVRMQGTALG